MLARAWYIRNADRLRQKKYDACMRYRAKKRVVVEGEEVEVEKERKIETGKFIVDFSI